MEYDKILKKVETKRKPGWDEDIPRLVLYADFMGFKNRVFSHDYGELKSTLMSFNKSWHNRLKPLQLGGDLKFAQFSDSILVVVNGTDAKMFNLISKSAICMMHEALKIKFGIKGVIAQGKFSFDAHMGLYFGRPLVDAYLLHEEIKYYGIVVHHSAENTVKNNIGPKNPYIKSSIYIERGKVAHYHLCWNLINENLFPENITPLCNTWLDEIEETVSGTPRQYIDKTREIIKSDEKAFRRDDDSGGDDEDDI